MSDLDPQVPPVGEEIHLPGPSILPVLTAVGITLTLIGIMVILLVMNWRLAIVAFTVLPLIVLITQWFRKNVRESYRIVRGWIAHFRMAPWTAEGTRVIVVPRTGACIVKN